MLNKKALAATAAADKLYVEDVFSTYLYTGTGASQTITNNVDLSTEGGLVWFKSRSAALVGRIFDTVRGNTKILTPSSTGAEGTNSTMVTAFNTNGFSLGTDSIGGVNDSGETFASWTFRKAEKFFDVVTWTGNGSTQAINHNLGSTPGCIIAKCTSNSGSWRVYHTSESTKYGNLNSTVAFQTISAEYVWGNNSTTVAPTSTNFTVGNDTGLNGSGETYVAYLFAHDAGGFGDSGSDNVISCGSFTTDGSGNATVSLGYEPQWVMYKKTTAAGGWTMIDVMREMTFTTSEYLFANLSDAAFSGTTRITPVPNGFNIVNGIEASSSTYIYIAIRRGPMKTPEAGTSVFTPIARTGTGSATTISGVGFAADLLWDGVRNTAGYGNFLLDKLRGGSQRLGAYTTAAEVTESPAPVTQFGNTSVNISGSGTVNDSGVTYVNWLFQRAPGFFDVVCYTGTGSATTVAHNLGVAPELMIVKRRDSSTDGTWVVYVTSEGATKFLNLSNQQASSANSTMWNNTSPTSSQFTVGTYLSVSSGTYVSYLFSSVSGVSKIGSYTGTGNLLQINCGFTSSARFVLIKRTDSDGAWFVYDSARGIVSGNDPYLLLNSTAAEVTNTDYIDTYSSGFELTSDGSATINVNNASYIYLAIA